MSNVCQSQEMIAQVTPHPDADRLEIAHIRSTNCNTQCVVPKGQFQVGQLVDYFPPDLLIEPSDALRLGVTNYLKHASWDGNGRTKCRVAACRLRGVPSYGFIAACDPRGYNTKKWVPVEKPVFAGDVLQSPPEFHKYTEIEHLYRWPDVIKPGTHVRVTEKLHGANCRIAKIKGEYLCGSHNAALKEFTASGKPSVYWSFLPQMIPLLANWDGDVVIFGEVFGPGIQDLDYGLKKPSFQVFDISVNGRYLDWEAICLGCAAAFVQHVPVIHVGEFDPDCVEEWTNGASTMPSKKFSGREGCVITPLIEQYDSLLGRVILKSVSADYLDRKGA